MEIIFIPITFIFISFLNATNFYILINSGRRIPFDFELDEKDRESLSAKRVRMKISFRIAFKLSAVAMALNKLLFTGSGYIASSYFSRDKDLAFYKTLSVFVLLEFLSASLWLGIGTYFGAKLAIKMPLVFVTVMIILGMVIWFSKAKFVVSIKKILDSLKEIGSRILWVMPFIIANIGLRIFYYFFLFKLFGFQLDILSIIKIVSVSFAIGYLSPAPGGLGFKDTGLVLLLVDEGSPITGALSIAVLDRIITTSFWAILGSFLGFGLIKDEIRKRWSKIRNSNRGLINLLFW